MATGAYQPSITPTLVLCLGDFGERVARALIPEIDATGPAVRAAVRWLRITWPEAASARLTDQAGHVLLEASEDDPERWVAFRGSVENALRTIGLHATREQLLQAGYGLPDDLPTGRRARCYLIAALREPPVVTALTPLLAHLSALLTPRYGPQSIGAFLNIATHRLDPDAPQRATVAAGLQTLPELVTGQPLPCMWPCVLLDWVKAGTVYAEGDGELCAALVALLRALLLADEPAALLQEALTKTLPADGEPPVFYSLGVAVIQGPPREAVLDWVAAPLMAEFLSRRCLDPLEGPQEITLGSGQQAAQRLHLRILLEALAEDLDAEVTTEPGLIVPLSHIAASHKTASQRTEAIEKIIHREGELLVGQVSRNQSALDARLLSESDPGGELPRELAEEINRGPHGLWGAEAFVKAVVGQIHTDQAVLTHKLARWPLNQERLAERVRQTQAALNAVGPTLPGPNELLQSGLVAMLWGYLFGRWAGRICGAGETAGAVLTAALVILATGLWYAFFKRRQIRRARQNYIAAVAALRAAQVEKAWLEAAKAVLAATSTWLEGQAQRLQATRKLLENVQALLVAHPLELPSNPVIVETLPYLDGYVDWLHSVLQDDPLMLNVQAVLERNQVLSNWSDLREPDLLKALVEAGRQTLRDLPQFSVEDVLISRDEETLTFHLDRLHQLATPLIDLVHPAVASQDGGPGTLDIACWEQGAVERHGIWLENHLPESASIAVTGDPQRVTYVRLVSGFDLDSLSGLAHLLGGIEKPAAGCARG